MMSKVVPAANLSKRRFEVFHNKCRGWCSSKKQFFARFDIDQKHIVEQGLLKNPRRLSLVAEDIAAIIQQGELIGNLCRDLQPLEIAIEGKLTNYTWTDLNKPTVINKELFVEVRIIIRESSPKHLIVTAYVLDELVDHNRPEVKRDVW